MVTWAPKHAVLIIAMIILQRLRNYLSDGDTNLDTASLYSTEKFFGLFAHVPVIAPSL
jgi:diketogulonate reductase-like aldo/keto reductase